MTLSGLFAYIIIPLYTVIFAMGTDWTAENFTTLGNFLGRREAFLVWGIIFGTYVYTVLKAVINAVCGTKFQKFTLKLAVFLLVLGVILPYFPQRWPNMAALHTGFCFASAAVVTLCTSLVIIGLWKGNKSRYGKYLAWDIMNIAISAVLFTQFGMVSSLLEIFFTLSLVFMVQSLGQNIRKM